MIGHTWAQYIPDVDPAALVVTREAAEAATAAKSAFLSNMSHELRNPLTAIIGYAELLAKRCGMDETQQRYLNRVHDASTALLTTINEVWPQQTTPLDGLRR